MTTDHSRLDGKIAIVTGGTQGLGATIARLFAERGAKGIVICGRNEQKGKAKAEEISSKPAPRSSMSKPISARWRTRGMSSVFATRPSAASMRW